MLALTRDTQNMINLLIFLHGNLLAAHFIMLMSRRRGRARGPCTRTALPAITVKVKALLSKQRLSFADCAEKKND